MTSSKKRFGVSIPAYVADQLELIANSMGADRSSIVTKALEEYLHEDLHRDVEHNCSGMIVYYGDLLPGDVREDYSSVIRTMCSVRLHGGVVTVLFVEGSYRDIILLKKAITRRTRKTTIIRYIPLYCSFKR
ncbi:MAG: CopG family transcriptional regulator [Desulfurococcaceae archaeon]